MSMNEPSAGSRFDHAYLIFAAQRIAFVLMILGMLLFVYLWYVAQA